MKRGVVLIGLLIILSSIVYSIELPWPENVPLGEAFHENLYTNYISNVNTSVIIVDGNLTVLGIISGNGSGLFDLDLDNITIGGILLNLDEYGNLLIDGNLSIGSNLFVMQEIQTDILRAREAHISEVIRAASYCDFGEEGECYEFSELAIMPGLLDIITSDPDAGDYGGDAVNIGGQIKAGSFAVIGSGDIFYYLDSGTGIISQITQDGSGNLYLAAHTDDVIIQDDLTIQGDLSSTGSITAPEIFKGGSAVLTVDDTITESQISDLNHFTTSDEIDPSFTGWDKSSGISITESQISNLNHFTTSDETDPQVGSTTSSIICYGTGSGIDCTGNVRGYGSDGIEFGEGGPKIYKSGNELIIDLG